MTYSKLYYAYGSNMLAEQMETRCPGAKAVARATLDGYRFIINDRGVATLVHSEKARIVGVVWEITRLHEATLDSFEGVAVGAYRKQMVNLRYGNNRRLRALTYIDPIRRWGLPREGYLEKIIAGAKAFSLPTRYVDDLYLWGSLEGHEILAEAV